MKFTEMYIDESVTDFPKPIRPMYRFSKRKHDDTGAVRTSSGEPYFIHPESVAKLCISFGGTDFEVKLALAHDTLEDAGAVYEDICEKFGKEIADALKEITNDRLEISKIGKENYINKELVSISKPALFVKLCDILHNSSDSPTPSQKSRMKKNIEYLISHRELDERETRIVKSIMEVFEQDEKNKLFESIYKKFGRLTEGDEMNQDEENEPSDDNQDNGAVDNNMDSTDMGDVDAPTEGGGTNETSETEETPDEKIDSFTSNANVSNNLPKDLVLNDGTSTDIAVDSKKQDEPLDKIDDSYRISFENGNWDSFSASAQEYSKNVTSVVQQFIPLAETSLIELFGSSNAYKRVSFDAKPMTNNGMSYISIDVTYQASSWIGTDIPIKSINQDQDYVRNRVSNIPGLNINIPQNGITINTNDGTLHIIASISTTNTTKQTTDDNQSTTDSTYQMIQN